VYDKALISCDPAHQVCVLLSFLFGQAWKIYVHINKWRQRGQQSSIEKESGKMKLEMVHVEKMKKGETFGRQIGKQLA